MCMLKFLTISEYFLDLENLHIAQGMRLLFCSEVGKSKIYKINRSNKIKESNMRCDELYQDKLLRIVESKRYTSEHPEVLALVKMCLVEYYGVEE